MLLFEGIIRTVSLVNLVFPVHYWLHVDLRSRDSSVNFLLRKGVSVGGGWVRHSSQ